MLPRGMEDRAATPLSVSAPASPTACERNSIPSDILASLHQELRPPLGQGNLRCMACWRP